jgi:hypothetical protein
VTFAADLQRFQVLVAKRNAELMLNLVPALHKSITEGSSLTGAPGQPVDTGFLRASWQYEFAPDLLTATIGTNVAYAPVIEYGTRSKFDPKGERGDRKNPDGSTRRAIKSTVGGIGSVRMTVANADRVQADVLQQVTR